MYGGCDLCSVCGVHVTGVVGVTCVVCGVHVTSLVCVVCM